jgi:26S proteasome regulatory subunit N8
MADREGAITTSEAVVSGEASGPKVTVVVHPLVLLSTVDHYNRVAKDTKKRVVGVLLGTRTRTSVDVTNSFAVPFEEDAKNPAVWYLDHNYLETMFRMYKKVNAREIVVGFYSTGPRIKENDIKIDELMRAYAPQPVFVIIDVRPENDAIPTTAYVSVEEVGADPSEARKEISRTFKHVSSMIGAYEAEEVGVEHLLRDVNDPTVSTLASQIKHKMTGLTALRARLAEMKAYLEAVLADKLPANNQILYNCQSIFNLMPNLNQDALVESMLIKTNDYHLAVYVASLIRCIIALHDLVNNKINMKRLEDEDEEKGTKKEDEKKDEKKDAEGAAEEKKDSDGDAKMEDKPPEKAGKK